MRVVTVILVSIVTSVLTTVGTAYLMARYDIVARETTPVVEMTVPDLVGLTEADARTAAAAAHLTFSVSGTEVSAKLEPGKVVRQSLPAGQQVPPDLPLSVVLAEARPTVPQLVGLTVEAANEKLRKLGYSAHVAAAVPDAKVPQGQVARQMPEAESPYVKGGVVTLQLSSGPAAVEMPKLLGKPVNQATAEVEALGLKPSIGWTSNGETPNWVILYQNPAAGTKVEPGSSVRFTVNR